MEQKYEYQNYQQFCKDMKKAGFKVTDYHGRNMYHGPAVAVGVGDQPSEQAVIRATKLMLVWDDLGKGKILYPAYRGPAIKKEGDANEKN